jgi:hypothetical protein
MGSRKEAGHEQERELKPTGSKNLKGVVTINAMGTWFRGAMPGGHTIGSMHNCGDLRHRTEACLKQKGETRAPEKRYNKQAGRQE